MTQNDDGDITFNYDRNLIKISEKGINLPFFITQENKKIPFFIMVKRTCEIDGYFDKKQNINASNQEKINSFISNSYESDKLIFLMVRILCRENEILSSLIESTDDRLNYLNSIERKIKVVEGYRAGNANQAIIAFEETMEKFKNVSLIKPFIEAKEKTPLFEKIKNIFKSKKKENEVLVEEAITPTVILTTKDEIVKWLEKMDIKNYFIRSDLSVKVDGSVFLNDKKLTLIPVKFDEVNGDFNIAGNYLTNLVNAPVKVDHFDCSFNRLTSLEGAPKEVKNFNCSFNDIKIIEEIEMQCNNFNASFNGLEKFTNNKIICYQKLNLSYNNLDTLDDVSFCAEIVDATHNNISKLSMATIDAFLDNQRSNTRCDFKFYHNPSYQERFIMDYEIFFKGEEKAHLEAILNESNMANKEEKPKRVKI